MVKNSPPYPTKTCSLIVSACVRVTSWRARFACTRLKRALGHHGWCVRVVGVQSIVGKSDLCFVNNASRSNFNYSVRSFSLILDILQWELINNKIYLETTKNARPHLVHLSKAAAVTQRRRRRQGQRFAQRRIKIFFQSPNYLHVLTRLTVVVAVKTFPRWICQVGFYSQWQGKGKISPRVHVLQNTQNLVISRC
jgi:hypothetical protein